MKLGNWETRFSIIVISLIFSILIFAIPNVDAQFPIRDPIAKEPITRTLDSDRDGIPDHLDNCPTVANKDQKDTDGDGLGDVCDSTPNGDDDGDGVDNLKDNCRYKANKDQSDRDGDGIGDVCDKTPDGDIRVQPVPRILDSDGDGIPDASDNCPFKQNSDQQDSDQDGIGDACDSTPTPKVPVKEITDTDRDGVQDSADNCPFKQNSDQQDNDWDGIGDACDSTPNGDYDGDGIDNLKDNCMDFPNQDQADSDGDGLGDVCDDCPNDPFNDYDADAVCGNVDNCPVSPNTDQQDSDQDGFGDACEYCANDPFDDSDGDGICGDIDNCPFSSNTDQQDSDQDGIGDVCDRTPYPERVPITPKTSQLPIASFSFYPTNPEQFQDVTLDASKSYDPDGQPLTYVWNLDTETIAQLTTSPVFVMQFPYPSTYHVTLTVTDPNGKMATYSQSITVKEITVKDETTKLEEAKEAEPVPTPGPIPMPYPIGTSEPKLIIPSYVKDVATFWQKGQIDDDSFVGTIDYMIETKIITIPDLDKTQKTAPATKAVPDWVKTTTKFWTDGVTSDKEYADTIQWLVKEGIIQLETKKPDYFEGKQLDKSEFTQEQYEQAEVSLPPNIGQDYFESSSCANNVQLYFGRFCPTYVDQQFSVYLEDPNDELGSAEQVTINFVNENYPEKNKQLELSKKSYGDVKTYEFKDYNFNSDDYYGDGINTLTLNYCKSSTSIEAFGPNSPDTICTDKTEIGLDEKIQILVVRPNLSTPSGSYLAIIPQSNPQFGKDMDALFFEEVEPGSGICTPEGKNYNLKSRLLFPKYGDRLERFTTLPDNVILQTSYFTIENGQHQIHVLAEKEIRVTLTQEPRPGDVNAMPTISLDQTSYSYNDQMEITVTFYANNIDSTKSEPLYLFFSVNNTSFPHKGAYETGTNTGIFTITFSASDLFDWGFVEEDIVTVHVGNTKLGSNGNPIFKNRATSDRLAEESFSLDYASVSSGWYGPD